MAIKIVILIDIATVIIMIMNIIIITII